MDIQKLQAEARDLAAIAKSGDASEEQMARMAEIATTLEARKAQADVAARAIAAATESTVAETKATEEAPASMGAAFVRSTNPAARERSERVEVRAITTANIVTNPTLVNVATPAIKAPFASAVKIERVSTGSVDYITKNVTYGADVVVEGQLKPETIVSYQPTSVVLDTIANFIDVTRQALKDDNRLAGLIDGDLRDAIVLSTESKIASAIATNVAIGTSSATTLKDAIRFAIADVETAGYEATSVVVHPTSLALLDLEVSGSFRLVDRNATIWGVPVVTSNLVPVGQAYVGNMAAGVTWFAQDGVDVYTTDSDADKFRKNIITVLAEIRAKAAVVAPAAIQKAAVVQP